MHRARRYIFNTLAVVSLLLMLGVVDLWLYSRFASRAGLLLSLAREGDLISKALSIGIMGALASLHFAIPLTCWWLWGDRAKGRLRCPKCWYDMEGNYKAAKLQCPECGHNARTEKRLQKTRRRRWLLATSTLFYLLVLTGCGPLFHVWLEWRHEEQFIDVLYEGPYLWANYDHEGSACEKAEAVSWSLYNRIGAIEGEWLLRASWITVTYDKPLFYLRDSLRGLNYVKNADLWGREVTDAGLPYLKKLPHLEELDIYDTNITDEGMKQLQSLMQLKKLHITDTSITDTGLSHLHGLKQLQKVYLERTKVTESGVARLQKALPNCRIESYNFRRLPRASGFNYVPDYAKGGFKRRRTIDVIVRYWYLIFAALPAIWLYKWNKRRKLSPNACSSCGYDLTGNETGVCPECGVAETKVE